MEMDRNCGDATDQRRIRFFRVVTRRMPTSHSDNALPVAYQGILFGGGGSTNSVEDRGQRERGSGGSSLP